MATLPLSQCHGWAYLPLTNLDTLHYVDTVEDIKVQLETKPYLPDNDCLGSFRNDLEELTMCIVIQPATPELFVPLNIATYRSRII